MHEVTVALSLLEGVETFAREQGIERMQSALTIRPDSPDRAYLLWSIAEESLALGRDRLRVGGIGSVPDRLVSLGQPQVEHRGAHDVDAGRRGRTGHSLASCFDQGRLRRRHAGTRR